MATLESIKKNELGFEAKEFNPNFFLEQSFFVDRTLNNSESAKSTTDLLWDLFEPNEPKTGENEKFIKSSVALSMLILFCSCVWIVLMFCACRRRGRRRRRGRHLKLFWCFGLASLLFGMLTLLANARAANGLHSISEGVEGFSWKIEEGSEIVDDTSKVLYEQIADLKLINQTCAGTFEGPSLLSEGAVGKAVKTAVDAINDVVFVLDDIAYDLQVSSDQLSNLSRAIHSFTTWAKSLIFAVGGALLVLMLSFTITNGSKRARNFSGRCTARLSLSCGVFFLLLALLLACVLSYLLKLGGAICRHGVPNSANMLIGRREYGFDAKSVCLIDEWRSLSTGRDSYCYFQNCVGVNPIYVQLEKIEGDLKVANDAVRSLQESALAYDSQCVAHIDSYLSVIPKSYLLLISYALLARCSQLQPLFESTLDEGLCNGFVSGLTAAWTASLVTCATFMAQLVVFKRMGVGENDAKSYDGGFKAVQSEGSLLFESEDGESFELVGV